MLGKLKLDEVGQSAYASWAATERNVLRFRYRDHEFTAQRRLVDWDVELSVEIDGLPAHRESPPSAEDRRAWVAIDELLRNDADAKREERRGKVIAEVLNGDAR
jgi:hypothetical protein